MKEKAQTLLFKTWFQLSAWEVILGDFSLWSSGGGSENLK
jgi:hypothetical protein